MKEGENKIFGKKKTFEIYYGDFKIWGEKIEKFDKKKRNIFLGQKEN